jgi:hypothetical protein
VSDVLAVIITVCSGIITGTYVFEMVVVTPALATVPMETSARIHRLLFERLPNRYMPPLGIALGLSVPALLLLAGGDLSDTALALYVAGWVASAVAAFLTFRFSRRMDKTIVGWVETEAVSQEYARTRASWDRLMRVRGLLGLAGFVCFCAASAAS